MSEAKRCAGCSFRVLVVADEVSRECLELEAVREPGADYLARALGPVEQRLAFDGQRLNATSPWLVSTAESTE